MPVVPGLLLSVRSEEGHAALDVPTRRATGESSTDGALVATTTRKPPARKTTTAKKTSTSKKSSASRGRSSGRGGGSKRPPSLIGRMWAATREHVGSQSNDLYGLLLILLGVISALALYADAAGPVGAFLEATWRGLFGVFGGVMPIVLLFFGGLVVFDRPAPVVGRVAVGTFMTGLALFGSWHLLAGHPHPSEGLREVWSGGGVVGWAVATPLEAGLSVWGAHAVFVVVLVLGLLIATGTPLARVLTAIRTWLTTDPSGADEPAADTPAPTKSATATKQATPDDDDRPNGDRNRATLAAAEAVQEPLDGVGEDDGLTAADRLAGRAPDPPTVATVASMEKARQKATKLKPVESWEDYQLPPLELLGQGRSLQRESERTIDAQTQALQETFDQFGVDATVARWSRGPTVTRFEIELGPGVQVKKVANMGDDIAYALAAPDVRIVAPIPGKSAIGVEVPNRQRDLITLGDILRSDVAAADPHPLFVALGKDIAGNPAMVDLTTMPHLLVAGATGSGKSVTLNAMIASVLMRARPDQVRMILIDPKRVELGVYNGAPHLLSPVVTDPKRATDAVQWCVKEMEMRYETLARLGYRNIDGYNAAVANGELADEVDPVTGEVSHTYRHMPYILLVIDELSDLMMVAARDVEDAICRIAQMARAVGIHMVIATQRPSVDVITGLIKANIPSRLALAVASQTDSRTILDGAGAEKLVGKGDMLFMPASQGKPSRLQGCFLTEREIEPIVTFCKRQREADYVDGVIKEGQAAQAADQARGGDDDTDEALLIRAAEQVVNSGLGSTSMLQRKLRIGFARAGRLMDELEELGVVGPNEGSKAREVIWSPEDLDNARQQGLL
jgi:DNA segregation ATPase FtsK/SpoIIIE, S-DNA-T family